MRIVCHGRRWIEDLPASRARWLLAPAWPAYRALVALRNVAYDHGWLAIQRVGVPVISLGNLTAGGTGKTPATLTVVDELRKLGRTPAILSRGYRGRNGANDEALLAGITPVVCSPDRLAGATTAIASGADCLVLDDGFQHRRMHRDLNIMVIDATRPWGRIDGKRGAVLPLGFLREGLRGLRRADCLWLTRTDLVSAARLATLRAELDPQLPRIEERVASAWLRADPDQPPESVAGWHGRRVVLASGIGNPAGFEAVAQRMGLVVVASHRFPDHHHYTATEAAELSTAARNEQAVLVITGKDAVKLRKFALDAYELMVVNELVDPAPLRTVLSQTLSAFNGRS